MEYKVKYKKWYRGFVFTKRQCKWVRKWVSFFDHMRFRLPATLKCCIHTKKKKKKKKEKKHKTQKTKNKTQQNKKNYHMS